jgi:hypothetical protein
MISELPTYKKLLDKSLLSKKGDIFSKAYLIINYPNISIPRISVVINEFNKTRDKYNKNSNIILNSFPAIVIGHFFPEQLRLITVDDTIMFDIAKNIELPKIGSMIMITNYKIYTYQSKGIILDYDVIFENVPSIFYKNYL